MAWQTNRFLALPDDVLLRIVGLVHPVPARLSAEDLRSEPRVTDGCRAVLALRATAPRLQVLVESHAAFFLHAMRPRLWRLATAHADGNAQEDDERAHVAEVERMQALMGRRGRPVVLVDCLAAIVHRLVQMTGFTRPRAVIAAVDAATELPPALLDESARDELLVQAAGTGAVRVFRSLLDAGANPTTDDHDALTWASACGHLDIVQALLDDGRANPSHDDDRALRWACQKGFIDVVRALLADSRVSATTQHNAPVGLAAQNGHLDIVRLLLARDDVDPSDDGDYALAYATEEGHTDIVRTLLADRRVRPEQMAPSIITAAAEGHADVIELHLRDGRVTDSHILRRAAKQARAQQHTAIAERIERHLTAPAAH